MARKSVQIVDGSPHVALPYKVVCDNNLVIDQPFQDISAVQIKYDERLESLAKDFGHALNDLFQNF